MKTPLLHKKIMLEKIPGKGGWTYAPLPEITPGEDTPFGWRRVHVIIDGIELRHYHLMSMGNGQLFLPVKAAIRKKIKKNLGDWVEITIYPEEDAVYKIPDDLEACLKDEPLAWKQFSLLSLNEQIRWVKWIEAPSGENTRISRISHLIEQLVKA